MAGLDSCRGRRTREHEDLEIVVLRDDVPAVLHAFAGPEWTWQVPVPGWLHPLGSPAFTETHQLVGALGGYAGGSGAVSHDDASRS